MATAPRARRSHHLALGLCLAAAAACDASPTPPEPVTVILFNGRMLTMAGDGTARALAIAGERIARVGSDDEVLSLAGPDTRRIDLQGRTVLPGIVDPHTHLFNDAWRLDLDLAGGQALLLENGITTVGNAFVTPEFLQEMRGFDASGALVVRTSLYLIYTDNCGSRQGDWWKEHDPGRTFGERLRIGGIKLFMDGGTCGRPAVRQEFAPGTGFGDLFLSAADVSEAIAAAEERGHQAIIHAIGDAAIEAAQDGIALALDGAPNTLRHRIDHSSLVPPDLVAGFRDIGIQPVVFGPYPMLAEMISEPGACAPSTRNPHYEANLGHIRTLLRELPDQHVAWHGDDPWVGPVSPFRELYLMVTRIRRSQTGDVVCPPEEWQLATAITAEEGLRMMTRHSARALVREAEVGSLEAGKLADLIVVTANPLDVPPEALWDIGVAVTVVGGDVVFCREAEDEACWDA